MKKISLAIAILIGLVSASGDAPAQASPAQAAPAQASPAEAANTNTLGKDKGFNVQGNLGNQGGNLGYQGGNTGYYGGNLGYQGGNLGYQGGNTGYYGGNLGYQGGNNGYYGGNLGYQGGNTGYKGGNTGYYGGNQGYYGGGLQNQYTKGSGKSNSHCKKKEGEIDYDYSCKAEKLGDALQNNIVIYGPNAILVNLDNRVQVEELEREGIFLQTGDLLFVTGREYTYAYQRWDEPKYDNPLDYDVLFPGLDYDMPLISDVGHRQEIVVLEAVGSGKTEYEIDLFWGGEEVRSVELNVYVDQQPGLVAATKRHGCKC